MTLSWQDVICFGIFAVLILGVVYIDKNSKNVK